MATASDLAIDWPPSSALHSPLVKVIVGSQDDQKFLMLHEAVLCYYSSYFRGALHREFKEAMTREIIIDDIKPIVMEAFSSWLYFHKLYDPKDPSSVKPSSDVAEERTKISLKIPDVVEIWLFGDRMGVPAIQNAAINAIHLHDVECWRLTITHHVKTIYARTTEGARLRTYLIDCVVFMTTNEIDVQKDKRFHVMDFYAELSVKLMKLRSGAPITRDTATWTAMDMCRFHIYEDKDCQGRAVTKETTKVEGVKSG